MVNVDYDNRLKGTVAGLQVHRNDETSYLNGYVAGRGVFLKKGYLGGDVDGFHIPLDKIPTLIALLKEVQEDYRDIDKEADEAKAKESVAHKLDALPKGSVIRVGNETTTWTKVGKGWGGERWISSTSGFENESSFFEYYKDDFTVEFENKGGNA